MYLDQPSHQCYGKCNIWSDNMGKTESKEVNNRVLSSEKKQRIINAAIEVIRTKSVEQTTMREIAAKAGLTTGAIYHHYSNKDELFHDVINQSIHFSHKIFAEQFTIPKTPEELLKEIILEISKRLAKEDEQKLHIALLADAVNKEGKNQEKYINNYKAIIKKTSDLFALSFGIENEEYKNIISSILIAALDGMAIQQSLNVFPDDKQKMIVTFNEFFIESIPTFLEKHNKS